VSDAEKKELIDRAAAFGQSCPDPIDWPREYGDLLAELDRVRASWKCPEKTCSNGLMPDTSHIAGGETRYDGSGGPVSVCKVHYKPCPHHKRAAEHVEHARRVLGKGG
jgi:uncharacterized protein YcgI (DUF1989 family)